MKTKGLMKKILVYLLMITNILLADASLEMYAQPLIEASENGSYFDSGTVDLTFHRLRTKLEFNKDVGTVVFFSKLSLDFAEKDYEDILKTTYLGMNIRPSLNWRIGRIRSSFGYESSISSKKVPLISRGEISDYQRKSCLIAGQLDGFELSGGIGDKIYYSAGLYNSSGFETFGGGKKVYINRLLSLPILTVSYKPTDILRLNVSVSTPYIGTVDQKYMPVAHRYLFSDYSVAIKVNNYEGYLAVFIGEDTASTKKYLPYTSNALDGLSQGVTFTNSIKIPIVDELSTMVTGRFEYLNGLKYNGVAYENRSFYYSLAGGIRFSYSNKYYVDLNYEGRFDDQFNTIHESKLLLQCTGRFKTDL